MISEAVEFNGPKTAAPGNIWSSIEWDKLCDVLLMVAFLTSSAALIHAQDLAPRAYIIAAGQ